MAFVGLEPTSTALASLPIACPHCGRETVHIYGLEGKAPRLLSWTLPVGLARAFARCAACGLSRRVSRRDRVKIRRAIGRNPRSAPAWNARGYVETALGRLNIDPAHIRRYPNLAGLQRVAMLLVLLVVISCMGTAYRGAEILAGMQGDRWAARAIECYDAGRFEAALSWYRRARWMFRIARSQVKEAKAAYMIGCSHYARGEYRDALIAYEESLSVWEATDDRDMQADCLMYIGYLRIALYDLHGAVDALERSHPLWAEASEWRLEADTFRALGIVYEGLEQYNAAIEAYGRALALLEQLQDRQAATELRLWIEELWRQLPNHGPGQQYAWRLSNAA